jgi:hypothetical protein
MAKIVVHLYYFWNFCAWSNATTVEIYSLYIDIV